MAFSKIPGGIIKAYGADKTVEAKKWPTMEKAHLRFS
jgi:hypothetical protein